MATNETMGVCAFDTLLTRNVPHIPEKIFFAVDYKSFKKCQEVSMTWNQLLTSESFRKIGKFVFREDIEKDLWSAIVWDNVDEVRRILSNGMVEVNCESDLRKLGYSHTGAILCYSRRMGMRIETPLYYAARMGRKEVVQLLIERGAEPNWQHWSEMTPLHMAAGLGHSDVVKVLMDAGADLNKVGMWGYTPLSIARVRVHKDVVNMLRDAGAQGCHC